jgi:tetratricopeptide (TPR) repeat protein
VNVATTLREQRKFKDAVPAYTAAAQVLPNNPAVYVGLLDCYLELGRQDEAMKALDKAAPLTLSGAGWNSLAWTLAHHSTQLDRAQRYAKAAISTESANLMTVTLDPLTHGVYARVNSLAATWDTMGWILFLRGDTASAETYLTPAWMTLQHPTIGDHLAELYEKLGRKDQALTYSGLAVAALQGMEYPQSSDFEAAANSRARIDRLAPSGTAKQILRQTAQVYRDGSSIAIPNQGAQSGKAEFAIMQTEDSKTAQARLITGDTALQPLATAVAA